MDCGHNKVLVRIESTHDNAYEDRQWRYSCGSVMEGISVNSCYWTPYTSFDAHWNVGQAGKIVAGIASFHDNSREDRRFSFKLCSITSPGGQDVPMSSLLNYGPTSFDQQWSFTFPSNAFLSSVESWHSNAHEDRQFVFKLVTMCRRQKSRRLQPSTPVGAVPEYAASGEPTPSAAVASPWTVVRGARWAQAAPEAESEASISFAALVAAMVSAGVGGAAAISLAMRGEGDTPANHLCLDMA